MTDILFQSASELARAITAKQVSSVEVVTAHLDRIATVNPSINAVVTLCAERALTEAATADAAIARGDETGALHGVPITLKDSIDTEGVRTTWGTRGRKDFVPDRDATVAARLRAAGAIVLGKTNTPEFTMGGGTDNDVFGVTRNPYDTARSPSGSSGGAAAIVAAGGAAFDIGSDTGGSIRDPAHVCGLVGLKPTYGRVPRTGHAVPFGLGVVDGLTQIGPMARSVADVALALRIISGPDGIDPSCPPVPWPDPAAVSVAGLRVAWFLGGGLATLTPEIASAARESVQVLRDAGSTVTEISPPGLSTVSDLYRCLQSGAGADWLLSYLSDRNMPPPGSYLGRRLASEAAAGKTVDLRKAIADVEALRRDVLHFMAEFDVIVCPPGVRTAWSLDAAIAFEDERDAWGHVYLANLLGWPAGVVPVCQGEHSLPIGVQIIAPAWREDRVLAVAMALEGALPGCPGAML